MSGLGLLDTSLFLVSFELLYANVYRNKRLSTVCSNPLDEPEYKGTQTGDRTLHSINDILRIKQRFAFLALYLT